MTVDLADVSAGRGPRPGTRKVSNTLLIYAPVLLYVRGDGTFLMEEQACNGLRLWVENFEKLIVMMPIENRPAPPNWVPLSNVGPALERIEVHPLPTAYRPDRFLVHLPQTRRRIRELIKRADYLSFAIGGLFGDWAPFPASKPFALVGPTRFGPTVWNPKWCAIPQAADHGKPGYALSSPTGPWRGLRKI